MTIVNKRNAVIGFVVIKVGKRVARRKARQVGGKLAPWGSQNGKKSRKQSSKS
jgi:hypothetical protein